MAYQPNTGKLPAECVVWSEDEQTILSCRAVHVRCFGGFDSRKAGHAPWPSAGGRPATNWAISARPHPFEIMEWELA